MSPGVIAIVAFIGMAMIIGIPAGIVIRRAIRTERARSRKRWAAVERDVGTYYGATWAPTTAAEADAGKQPSTATVQFSRKTPRPMWYLPLLFRCARGDVAARCTWLQAFHFAMRPTLIFSGRVDRDQIHAAIAQERRNIADLIDSLDDSQLATESLCTGWDVKTVGSHLVSGLADGTTRAMLLSWRRMNQGKAVDEMARRRAHWPAAKIAASLRDLADRQYWRPPPQPSGMLAEILCHSGDMRIPLGLPFEPDPQLTVIALDFLTGPVPIGLVKMGQNRGIRWHATDVDRTWGKGPEIRGRAADLLMAAVGRSVTLDALDGPALPLLRQRISG